MMLASWAVEEDVPFMKSDHCVLFLGEEFSAISVMRFFLVSGKSLFGGVLCTIPMPCVDFRCLLVIKLYFFYTRGGYLYFLQCFLIYRCPHPIVIDFLLLHDPVLRIQEGNFSSLTFLEHDLITSPSTFVLWTRPEGWGSARIKTHTTNKLQSSRG